MSVFDKMQRIIELERFICPKYARVAFNLPPACGTFWGLMEEEIDKCALEDGHVFSQDVEDVLTFLGLFFSNSLVDTICANMELLQTSFLGIHYTLRLGKVGIARNVLHDVQMECDLQDSPLHGFLGHVDFSCDSDADDADAPCDGDVDEGGWQTQRRTRRRSSAASEGRNVGRSDEESVGAGRGLGRGAGRGAGGGRGTGEAGRPQVHFETMLTNKVVVPMSSFSTPPYGDHDRHHALKAWSWEFVSHSLVGDHSEKVYNPNTCESGSVFLFHGTRNRHLDSFQRRGIFPLFNRNEFSMREAFYVSNSIRQTFEHSLHHHLSTSTTDTIIVILFEVDVRVLHGLEPPLGECTPLTNLWFPDTEENTPEWQKFCKDNFMLAGPEHSYDIVIGPMCLPKNDADYGKLEVKLPRNAPFTQIAFCSARSRSWLESCFKKVFVETRGE